LLRHGAHRAHAGVHRTHTKDVSLFFGMLARRKH
jgi:hypothetical protein